MAYSKAIASPNCFKIRQPRTTGKSSKDLNELHSPILEKDVTHCEGTAVVVDRVNDGGARGEVEPNAQRFAFVDCNDVIRTAIYDCVGAKASTGRLAGVEDGSSEGRGGEESNG